MTEDPDTSRARRAGRPSPAPQSGALRDLSRLRRLGVRAARGARRAGHAAPAVGRALRPSLPQPGGAVGGPRAGRHDRADQVGRPLRPRPGLAFSAFASRRSSARSSVTSATRAGRSACRAGCRSAAADRARRRVHADARPRPHPRELAGDRRHGRADRGGLEACGADSALLSTPPRTPATRAAWPCRDIGTRRRRAGAREPGVDHAPARVLPPREKRILLLRFVADLTQAEIAEKIGVTQMHVSRLLSRTLDQLRASLQETV